jgi:UDP-2,3-diacylglucosamine pyrophosphatase LpxH
MRAFVVSDVHVGSSFLQAGAFLAFLDGLPAGATLVLNGDTFDARADEMPPAHHAVAERLAAEAGRREVVCVEGNHDGHVAPATRQGLTLVPSWSPGPRLVAVHGNVFHNLRPYHRTFIAFFRWLHRVQMALGGEAAHVARFAKNFPTLYGVLRRNVAMNAVEYAKEHGCRAVTCGHTHYAEELEHDGIRYINTGCWTETPIHYLDVNDSEMQLKEVPT